MIIYMGGGGGGGGGVIYMFYGYLLQQIHIHLKPGMSPFSMSHSEMWLMFELCTINIWYILIYWLIFWLIYWSMFLYCTTEICNFSVHTLKSVIKVTMITTSHIFLSRRFHVTAVKMYSRVNVSHGNHWKNPLTPCVFGAYCLYRITMTS